MKMDFDHWRNRSSKSERGRLSSQKQVMIHMDQTDDSEDKPHPYIDFSKTQKQK